MVTLTIDGRSVTVPNGTTILEAARSVNINIPTLCCLKGINEIAACKSCFAEKPGIDPKRLFVVSVMPCTICSTPTASHGACRREHTSERKKAHAAV